MIKVISFDIGGTILLSDKKEDNYSFAKLKEVIGLPYDLVKNAYKEVFQKQKGTLLELTTNFCDLLEIPLNDKILDFFKNKFSKDNIMSVLNVDIFNVLDKLKKHGYQIVLFSNSCCLIDNSSIKDIIIILIEYFIHLI